ncbi:hypothetical protein [Brevibacterium sp. JSBI002]|uniref:hypothetical protein n=1 Tax=Brevibacterium sp. JSBI002 TaxID=2886045 RepID=UPI002230B685|nr:hypothetical protein [Brevibacterium sp. JSBI002]UZD62339.1 hypothetical protein LJ362_00245 [Brevibacterium sp. JSBI002]
MRYSLIFHAPEPGADGPEAGLAALDAIDAGSPSLSAFQPAGVLRAHLLTRLGRTDEAATARRRALDLTTDPAERDYLSVGLT